MVNTCDYLCLVLAIAALLTTGSEGQCNYGYERRYVLSSNNVLTSPGYYENGTYPPNSHCRWLLEAIDGGAMNVYVHTMDLGGPTSANCSSGYSVLLYDGQSPFSSPLLARLCRYSDEGRHFYSTGRFVFVEFFSGQSASGTGFRLEMKSLYRTPVTTTTTDTTKTTSNGSSETGGSTSFSILYLLVAFGAVFCFTCLVCFCRCIIDKNCNSNPSRNSRYSARNPNQNTPNHAHNAQHPAYNAQNHAHFALSHAPSTIPANLRTENELRQLNSSANNAHSASSGNLSTDGNVNVGYSNFGEAPPPYDEVVVSGNGSGQNVALPSYTEAIRMSDITPKVDTVDI